MANKRKKPSVSSFFRQIYKQQPELLESSSNEEVYNLFSEMTKRKITDRDKAILSNLKSLERKKAKHGTKGSRKAMKAQNHAVKTAVGRGGSHLDRLEESIDDCMSAAKVLDREGLLTVIDHLRKARNEVVILRAH